MGPGTCRYWNQSHKNDQCQLDEASKEKLRIHNNSFIIKENIVIDKHTTGLTTFRENITLL